MAGEIWRSQFQAAVETTYGSAITTATRRMYYTTDSHFTRVRAPRMHKFATATRDNSRAFTQGPVEVAGDLKQPLSASEIIELLLMGVDGTVTATQPDAGPNPTVYLWTFKPGTSFKSGSIQWQDGANAWQASGVMVNTLKIAGNANGPNEVTAGIFGKDLVAGSMTGSLAERLPDFVEGWETKLWVDALGATPGTTQLSGLLVNWDVNLGNNLGRKYFAANSNTLGAVAIGELLADATLTFEASNEDGIDAFEDWDGTVGKLVRLDFGNNVIIGAGGTLKKFVTIDLPGYWSAIDLGQVDAMTRVYQLKLEAVYDVTNTFMAQIRCQNLRATAW